MVEAGAVEEETEAETDHEMVKSRVNSNNRATAKEQVGEVEVVEAEEETASEETTALQQTHKKRP